jgi:hypothetical protein
MKAEEGLLRIWRRMGRYKEWIREGNGGKCGQITLYAYIKMPQ